MGCTGRSARFEARAARVAVGNTAALVAVGATATLLTAGTAAADDNPPETQHNVTYRARVDGLARGALITYRISDAQVNSADPAMLPGRTFEATAVLSDPKEAGMRISIQWPYSANLHCEILVDDELTVQADQFISPRVTPARDDPDYGAMNCGAPLSNAPGTPVDATDSATPSPTPATTPMPNPADTDDVPAADLTSVR
ncbi:MAG: hypothetical protein KDB71_02500 [Mycobacterium sp.]|nr:hypothetical protein [Mycobacterium sp.]